MTDLAWFLVGTASGSLAVLVFAALRISRTLSDAAKSLDSLATVGNYIARLAPAWRLPPPAEEPAYLGALLEFGEDGLPWRMSASSKSPYYFPTEARVTLDGVPVERCLEADRVGGWVQCDDEMGKPLPRRFGRVEVTVG